ncbi:MAG: hypothetical protein QXN55_00905 [Candidatus Nitrosotenuis sp.]
MDEETIRRIAKKRKAQAEINVNPSNWTCPHCKRTLTSEGNFMRHSCRKMERAEILKTSIGQGAFAIYADWLTLQKRAVPSIDTFAESRYFSVFIKFAEFIKKLGILKPTVYVRTMIALDYPPAMWMRNEAYGAYIHQVDKSVDNPETAVAESISVLLDFADKLDVDLSHVLNEIGAKRFIELFRKRQLSPWIIFTCGSVNQFVSKMDNDDKEELKKIINIDFWIIKFEEMKHQIADLKQLIKEEYGL